MDLREICLEEIALEGLEGITFPTLWLRLQNREPKLPYKIISPLKEYLWKFIIQHDSLEIYQIPSERLEPQIFDRFQVQNMSNAVPIARAPDELETLVEVYTTTPVIDVENVRGACSNFHQRLHVKDDVSNPLCTLSESLKLYGKRRLIVVASQDLREKAILPENLNPTVLSNLMDVGYCVLERIGRSRRQGDLQSVLGKFNFGEKTLHIHHVIDNLQKCRLVVKKNHTYKREDKNMKSFFQILVLLTKFDRDCMTFGARSLQSVVKILKTCPDQTSNLGELRELSCLEDRAFRAVCKALQKSGDAIIHDETSEKRPKSIYVKTITLIRKSSNDGGEEEDDDDDIQNMFTESSSYSMGVVLERPLICQCYRFVLEKGAKGVTQRDVLGFLKGFGRLEARNVCKILGKKKLVNMVLVDHGKQRVQTFIPNNLTSQSLRSLEFSDEKKRMQKLLVETTKFMSDKTVSFYENRQNETIESIAASCELSFSQNPGVKDALTVSTIASRNKRKSNSIVRVAESRAGRLNSILRGEYEPSTMSPTHIKKWDSHLTTRKIKRHNIILEQLNEEKIIEGFRSIQRILMRTEELEGVTTKIDKKTIIRLIDRMHYEGVLQHSVIPITHNGRTESFHFIMALDCPPKLLKCAVEQARFKLLGDEENRVARLEQDRLQEEMKEERRLRKAHEENLLDPTYQESYTLAGNEKLATKFFKPKFKRLRIIHNFLWYLVYGHPQSVNWTPDIAIADPDEEKVHLPEMTWKRFLPPAPIHFHDGLRWLQLGDIAVILPLSIFCQFHRVTHRVDDLEIYLTDEEKRHMLVRHLPQEIRTYLFYRRRYMFSLMMCIEQLVFMGLITMRRGRSGRNANMPKENMMIYVHKNVTMLDTRSSMKQHVKIEPKPYDRIQFTLNSSFDVAAYWFKLQDISVQTRLGFTEYQEPDYDIIKNHLGTTELKKFVAGLNEKQSTPVDDGQIPGDQRGAAGLDSSMFSYLYRNWRSKPHHRIGDFRMKNQESNVPASKRLPKLKERNMYLRPAKKKLSTPGTEVMSVDGECEVIATEGMSAIRRSHSKRRAKKRKHSEKCVEKRSGADGANLGNRDDETENLADVLTDRKGKPAKGDKSSKRLRQSDSSKRKITGVRSKQTTNEKPQAAVKPRPITVSNIGRNERVKGGKGVKRGKPSVVLDIPAKKLRIEKRRRRNVQPKIIKQGRQKVKYVDKNDLEAIKKRKGRLRVSFTKTEDSLLLICHIATSLLTNLYWKKQHRPRKQIISWLAVRDVMQKRLVESSDKTSYSVNRRTVNLMKNPETRICHDISVADTSADKGFLAKYLPADFDLELDYKKTEQMFRELVEHLRERFKTKPGLFVKEIPDSNDELLQIFTPKTILRKIGEKSKKRRLFRDHVVDRLDITRAIAENMTYIALTMGDAEFSVYQAYRAFEAFPEATLSEVLILLQVNGIVSTKPNMVRRLPFGIRSHRLAFNFFLSLKATTPHETIDEICEVMEHTGDLKTDKSAPAGQIFLLSYLLAKGPVNLSIQIPDQVILPEAPNQSLFENQFLSMLEKTEEDLLKEPQEGGSNSSETNCPSTSIMGTAARILGENLDEEPGDGSVMKINDSDSTKLKVAEVLRLYTRHPSYTNWLMLINCNRRSEASESKFMHINSSVNPDSVVLSPCTVTVENIQELLKKYSFPEKGNIINKQLDSIKMNPTESQQNWLHQREETSMDTQSFILRTIFDIVDKSAEFGMTKSEICDSVEFGSWTASSAILDLQKQKLLFGVGICEKKYVTYNYVHVWAAKGFNFCGKEVNFQKEILYEISLLRLYNTDDSEQPQSSAIRDKTAGIPDPMGESVTLPAEASQTVMDRYKEVDFICRPWHTVYGYISFKTAKKLILSVYLKISSSPGITKEDLCGSFTFQPICIVELIEILLEVGCIRQYAIETPGPRRMFGAPTPSKKTTYYEATQDGMIIISQWSEAAKKLIGKAQMKSTTHHNW